MREQVPHHSDTSGQHVCKLCRKSAIKRLHRDLFDAWICLNCCVVFTTSDRGTCDIQNLYTTSYGNYLANKKGSGKRIQRRLNWILRFVGAGNDPSVIEVGCANGQLLYELKKHGFHVTGIEPGTVSSLIAGDKIGHENVFQGFLENFQNNKLFNIAILLHTFEHLEKPRESLEILYDLLEPGGLLFMEVPNFYSLTGGFFRNWSSLRPSPSPNHLFVYTRRTLGRLVQACGFELLEAKNTRRTVRIVARKATHTPKALSLPAENPRRMLAFHWIAWCAAFLAGCMNRGLNHLGIRRSRNRMRVKVCTKKPTKPTKS